MQLFLKKIKISTSAQIMLSFIAAIFIGGILLHLPVCTTGPAALTWTDSFFFSASGVCVTGLAPINISLVLSLPGQIVLLLLIQAGGLGIMTLSTFFLQVMGRRLSLMNRLVLEESFAPDSIENLQGFIKTIIIFVFVTESLGALLLFPVFYGDFSFLKAVYLSVFHSVSAFCNAGFSPFPDSLQNYKLNPWCNAIFMFLIITGGIGFIVLQDIWNAVKKGRNRISLLLHTRLVLSTTAVLTIAGAFLIFVFEYKNRAIAPDSLSCIPVALFHSVTARTAGFNTVDLGNFRNVSLIIITFLMFVGASPGSCGGGIKTTALAVLVFTIISRLRGQTRVNAFNRTIPDEQLVKTVAIFILAVCVVFIFSVILLISEHGNESHLETSGTTLEYLFECVSAFSTVGLSLGVTQKLSLSGKWLIIVLMFIGRVGLLTVVYEFSRNRKGIAMEYAEEGVMIG
ncbi:MAG: potassium transporter TrkG [bacterium]